MENLNLNVNKRKDLVSFGEEEGWMLRCEIGVAAGQYVGIAFQTLSYAGSVVDATFMEEIWGYSSQYDGENAADLEELLDEFAQVVSETYGKEWSEKPQPSDHEDIVEPAEE